MGEAKRKREVGRLAMRHEGEWWNAYYAKPGTMEGAILLGTIAVRFVQTQERRDAFIAIMRDAVGEVIAECAGAAPTWTEPQPAPESERAGHG